MHITQNSKKVLSIPEIDYKPATLLKQPNGEWRIVFYSKEPISGNLKRVRARVAPMSNQKEQLNKPTRSIIVAKAAEISLLQ